MKFATSYLALVLLVICSTMAAASPASPNVNDESEEAHLSAKPKGAFCQLRQIGRPTDPQLRPIKHKCSKGCTNGRCVPDIGVFGTCWKCSAGENDCKPNGDCTP